MLAMLKFISKWMASIGVRIFIYVTHGNAVILCSLFMYLGIVVYSSTSSDSDVSDSSEASGSMIVLFASGDFGRC